MEQIKYLPRSDLAVPYFREKASTLISKHIEPYTIESIEEALSIHSIIR